VPGITGEFICKAVRDAAGRDEFVVVAETSAGGDDRQGVAERCRAVLKQKIGIEVAVELVDHRATAPLTQIDVRQKPIRLIDERFEK